MMLSCAAFAATDSANSASTTDSSAAGTADLSQLQKSLCNYLLEGSIKENVDAVFKSYMDNHDDALGVRGFFGPSVAHTPENIEIAMKHGLIWWGMKWNFASSLEEAIEHRMKARRLHEAKGTTFTDVIASGQYIIGSEEELEHKFEGDEIEYKLPEEKVRHMFSRGAYEIDHLGNVKTITPEHLARHITLTGMTYHKSGHLPGAFGKNSVTLAGWVGFKMHGIHDYSTWKHSAEAVKLRKLARTLADSGHTVRFNIDYEWMLDKIVNQTRSYREQEVADDGSLIKGERKSQGPERSRYKEKPVYQTALDMLNAGKGYSVGLYNGRGELIAGEIGFRDGNHLYGDSVFYDKVEHAKVAALALFDALDAAGMSYSDPGMITPYTASMGAELIPFREYLTKIKGGPAGLIELPDQWDPRTSEDLDAALNEVAKRKNQGLGSMKITRRSPIVSGPAAEAAAERAGLIRGQLNLVFVESAAQAAAHVADKSWAELPVYIEGVPANLLHAARMAPVKNNSEAYGPMVGTLDLLRMALTGPDAANVKAYFIGSARHPDARKSIPLKQLLDVLELKVTADSPTWDDAAPVPTISVNGWGFR